MADFASDIRNLQKELSSGITEKFQKELDESRKKLQSLTKSADELGTKIGNWVDPAGLMDKKLASMGVELSALQKKSHDYEVTMDKSKNQLYSITEQLEEMQNLQQKSNGNMNNLLPAEQKRLQYLESQRDNLSNSFDDYQKIYFQAMKLKVETDLHVKSLEKQQKTLNNIQAIYKTIMSLGEKYDKMLSDEAKTQGTTKDEINRQYDAIQKINTGLTANQASNQEILKAVTAIRKEYAMTDSQLAAVGKQAANISRFTGLSVDEAVKFQSTLAEVGGTSMMAQENMAAIASKAAEAAGVPMGMVMKDVANASNNVRVLFKGNTTELIKQAAEARKLGTSLDSAAKSAEALLNFESSIGNELKLSALLGKNINFNESRRLAFAGDIIGAEKALQRELEKVGDLDKLNVFQRKALAEVTGKDFGELQKIQTQRKNMLEAERMFPEEAAKMKKAQEELAALQKKGPEARKQELELMMKQKTAEAESAKLAAAKEAALLNLGKILQPVYATIMSIQTFFFNAVAAILSFKASVGQALGAIAIGATVILTAFFTLKYGLSKVLDFLGNMFGKAAQSAGEGLGKGLEGISKGITALGTAVGKLNLGDMAKLAVLLVLITGAAIGLGYAMSMLGQTSASQILAFTAALIILGAGLAGIALLMTPPSPLGAGLLIFAGALAITSLAAIGFAKAIQMVTPSLDKIGTIIIGLGNIIGSVVKDAFKTMYDTFVKLPEVISGVATPLIKLAMVSPLLFVAATGITALTASLIPLSLSMFLLPVEKLQKMSLSLSLLSLAGNGLQKIPDALEKLNNMKFEFPKVPPVSNILPTVLAFGSLLPVMTELGKSAQKLNILFGLLKDFSNMKKLDIQFNIKEIDKKRFDELDLYIKKVQELANIKLDFGFNKSLLTFSEQLSTINNSATGVKIVVDTLKEIQGMELPKLDVDIKNVDKLKEFNESKQKQNDDLKMGLELVAQKIDNLANVMINGGIAVNIDGQLVSRTLSTTAYRSGGFGQSTTRA